MPSVHLPLDEAREISRCGRYQLTASGAFVRYTV